MPIEYHNYGEIFPIAEVNEQLKERIFNNVAHEINVLLGANAFKQGPVKLFDKSISLIEGKYVVIDPTGKPISWHPDAESALKALMFVNMSEAAFGKSIREENGKWVVYDSTGKPVETCPDKASAIMADMKVQVGKMIAEKIAEFEKYEPSGAEQVLINEYEKEVEKAVSGKVNSNGTFRSGFDGCVKHMMDSKNLPKENAQKLCAYIGRNAGKIKKKPTEPDEDDNKVKKTDESAVAKSSTIKVNKNNDGSLTWELEFPITKLDNEKRLVGGIVYEPDIVDAQGDSAGAGEIEKAAHKFLQDSRTLGLMHKEEAGPRAKIVESYIAPCNLKMGTQNIAKGTWVMVVKVFDNDLWNMVKDGKITGFSMGGRAREEKPNLG